MACTSSWRGGNATTVDVMTQELELTGTKCAIVRVDNDAVF